MVEKTDIDGVFGIMLKPMIDDRGCFMELMKQSFIEDFIVKQVSMTVAYPGIIKAFHWHERQTDVWFALSGNAKCVLYDLREGSATYKKFKTVYMGESEHKLLVIPPRVAHGYQVLGNSEFQLLYCTNQMYNPTRPDEGRIAFDSVGYDWEIQNR